MTKYCWLNAEIMFSLSEVSAIFVAISCVGLNL